MKHVLSLLALVIIANCTPVTNNSELGNKQDRAFSHLENKINKIVPFDFVLAYNATIEDVELIRNLVPGNIMKGAIVEEYLVNLKVPSHVNEDQNITLYSLINIKNQRSEEHFYLTKFKGVDTIGKAFNASINNLNNFSGIISIQDLSQKAEKSNMFLEGKLLGEPQTKGELAEIRSKLPVYECFTVTTEHWMDYYYTSGGYTTYSHSILVDVTEETTCEEYTPGGSSGGGGGGTVTETDTRIENLDWLESKYKPLMSEAELQLYNNLSLLQRFKYLWSAERASNIVEDDYRFDYETCGTYNTQADALRHTLWSAFSTIALGSSLTKELTDAHEEKPMNYEYQYKEKEMDLFNNAVGRQLAAQNYYYIEHDFVGHDANIALRTGQLRYLSNLGPGCVATSASELIPTDI